VNVPILSYNLEAEQATIGSALLNPGAAVLVASWLTPELFYDERHARIWTAWLALFSAGTTPNLVTIQGELKRRGQLDDIGGFDYLNQLTDLPPGIVSTAIEDYAVLIEEAAIDRQLVTVAQQVARIGQDGMRSTSQKLGDVQQLISRIQPRGARQGLVPISASAAKMREQINAVQAGNPAPVGTLTDYRDLDEILGGGFQPGDLILLAARPSVGKSSLALSVAYNIAKVLDRAGRDRDVLVFSLEMTTDQLHQRMVSMETKIDLHRLRTLQIRPEEIDELLTALDQIAALPVFVNDTPAVPVSYVRNEVYRHIAERGKPALIFVDYLQLMTAKGENRVQEVSAISRALKALAKEIDVPIVALSQLSRALEERPSKVPLLSDLRESGSLEQDADVVLFIYRDELYNKDTDRKGIAEIHVAKHRNGPIGVIPMRFDAATTRFETLTYRSPDGY
jgi:replicative DNA helicase